MVHNGDKNVLMRIGETMVYKAYIGDYPVFKTPTIVENDTHYYVDADLASSGGEVFKSSWVRNTSSINRPNASSVPANTHCWNVGMCLHKSMTLFVKDVGFYDDDGTGVYLEPVITSYTWSKDNGDNVYNVISEDKYCPVYGTGTYKCEFEWYYKDDPQQTAQSKTFSMTVADIR